MRISGTESSSVILSQKKFKKVESDIPEVLLWFFLIFVKILYALKLSREKGRDLTRSYIESPYTHVHRNFKRTKWQHKQRHKMFD